MARKGIDFESQLNDLVSDHVRRLVSEVSDAVRRAVGAQIAAVVSGGSTNGVRLRLGRKKQKARDFGCIAPGCKNKSKGPRFHYLCDKHKDAPKKDYEAWRDAKG